MPDDSESQDLDTESEEEEEGEGEEDEDMELDDHGGHGDDVRYYEQHQPHGQGIDYVQRQYYSTRSSGDIPSVTRVQQTYAIPVAQPPSHRHPQQLPSSQRIVLPPQDMPPLSSWSRQSAISTTYPSQSSAAQNQHQPQYNQRHPQEMNRRRDNYRQATPEQQQQYTNSRQPTQQPGRQSMSEGTMTVETTQQHYHQQRQQQQQRPAFMSQPVYQLACAACIRPLCLRAMKAVMLSDHSKELYSTDMPPAGLQLVNDDRQVRHCACRIRDSACLGCGQVAGYHVTQPCSDCLKDQNNGHFWMFYSSAVVHYKRLRLDGHVGDVMLWAHVPSINHDQALAQQLRREVPILSVRTSSTSQSSSSQNQQGSNGSGNSNTNDERPLTACVEMEEWLNSPMTEVICR
ncbi:Protein fam72a [Linnemannia zychae]|nr:Protein fam72a [Linnemannia zychae]